MEIVIYIFLLCFQVDNGASLIEIKDNGYGISKEDAPYMGRASYTSKISNFEDLGMYAIYNFVLDICFLNYSLKY